MRTVLALALAFALTGCAAPTRYVSGENFSTISGGSCGTRQTVDGRVPWCGFSADGDEWNESHNQ